MTGVVDWWDAVEEAAHLLPVWLSAYGIDNAPAFSGGIFDAWPSEAVDAWPIFASEVAAVRDFMRYTEERR